ncbi:MAG: serine/threonine-protein kinase [Planctomycetota bacterium]
MQIGPYRVDAELGRGGAGVVYRARGPDGRAVALKLLPRPAGPQALERVRREVQTLVGLEHPHVVRLLQAGSHDGRPWLALELVEGESLGARLRRGPLSLERALHVTGQLLDALACVHARGTLHRDLKPDNVLLRGDDALLTDFGLALSSAPDAQRLTASGVFLGTPGYWAPEQAQGALELQGPWTDVYGLGAVLYACLTGLPPVQADSLPEYLESIRFRRVEDPRRLRPEVPPWLSALCLACLEVVPGQRPQSAGEVARGLAARAWPAPAEAETAEPRGRPATRPRRGPLLVGALGASAAALALAAWAARALAPGADGLAVGAAAALEERPPPELVEAAVPAQATVRELMRQERWEEAKQLLDRRIAEGAPRAADLYDRGVCQARLGDRAAALADHERALALQPHALGALQGRVSQLLALKRYPEALEAADRAQAEAPGDPRVILLRAACLARLGRHEEAIVACDRTLALDPEQADAYEIRGMCRYDLGRPQEALADLDAALARVETASAYSSRAACRARLDQFGLALRDLDRALELEPGSVPHRRRRAACLLGLGRYEEALAACDEVLRDDPAHAAVQVTRARCLHLLGRLDEAHAGYARGLELDPSLVRQGPVASWIAECEQARR